jgi:hypothetical protein
MADYEARSIIEALRSGISSRAVGQYFSHARQEITAHISKQLDEVCRTKASTGMIITGKYGEGKTHLLNTVFNMAHSSNMVVSFVSLSKETPFNKLDLVYQKLLNATYLPKRLQPGFMHLLNDVTANSTLAEDMLAFTGKQLETDKLYYLFRSFLRTDDLEEKHRLMADLEGDFINNATVKQIYKRIFSEKVKYNLNFVKTKHSADYFAMLSHLFLKLGYNGWVILFDETELIGRLGKKSRYNSYKNMAQFLFGPEYTRMQATYSLFALTASFREDVLEAKNEYENAKDIEPDSNGRALTEKTLKAIETARQLAPLSDTEISEIMRMLFDFYKRAYDWQPDMDMSAVTAESENHGLYVRSRIRAAVECLDQLYQYGEVGGISVGALNEGGYDEMPVLADMDV